MTDTMKALHGKLIRAEYELGRAGVAASQDEADKPIAVSLELVRECLATLRAALAPPADDEVEAIRGRHEADNGFESDGLDSAEWRASLTMLATRAHTDRATLLRAFDAMAEENARMKEALQAIVDNAEIGEREADTAFARAALSETGAA